MRTDAQGNQVQATEGGFFANLAGPHRKIEHWGIRVGVILSLMLVTVGYSEVHHHNVVVRQEMTVNPSGTQVKFSKAGATFVLKQAVLSKDGHWAFIPFKISDMTYLPNDPAKYRILIQAKGNKHTRLAYNPMMKLILFGSTGKGAIAIYSSTKIQNQPVTFYLLNMKQLAKGNADDVDDDTLGASGSDAGISALQKKYDLVTFSANPGALQVQKAKRTSASLNHKSELYMDLFGGVSDKGIYHKIAKDKTKIKDEKEMIAEDKSKLTQMGFKVPNDPDWMKDDWKPFDWVNVNTGKTKTGKNVDDYLNDDSVGTAIKDKDNVDYPDTLTSKNGIKMTQDGDDSHGSAQGQQASSLWQDLQDRWDAVHSLKRDIWVIQQGNLYDVNQERNQQKDETTIGPATGNVSISKIHIRQIKMKGWCLMVSIKALNKRVQALKRAVDDGVNYEGSSAELALLDQAMSSLNGISKKLSPVKESIVNEQAAKREYSNQDLLSKAGLNIDPHDAVVQYIKMMQRQQQSQQQGGFQGLNN